MMTAGKQRKKKAPSACMAEILRERLAGLGPGSELGTEVSLAGEFGVSRMTARKAVTMLVDEGLVERRAGVGVFVRDREVRPSRFRFFAGNFLWDAAIRTAGGFRQALSSTGTEIDFFDAAGDVAWLKVALEALPATDFTGAAVLSVHDPSVSAVVADLAAKGFPIVVIDEVFDAKSGVVSVVSDNFLGGRLVAERLIHVGHRELAFLGDCAADSVQSRWVGFRQIAVASGLSPVRFEIKVDDRLGDWMHLVHDATLRILRRKTRPTAIFCSCDAIARYAMRTLEMSGVAVPRDISIVGFDDDPIAEWTTPALTTVRQDFSALGRTAAQVLLSRRGHSESEAGTVTVPVSLVMRDSIAPCVRALTGEGAFTGRTKKQGGRHA